jgi:organic radical activating enzyme
VEEVRNTPGRSVLLFITDRCPVGCGHCSVDSRPDSPTISDFALFDAVLDGICSLSTVSLVGISGGEPFVERRGLTRATSRFRDAGKGYVVYTSGVWARGGVAPWIREVLAGASTVFLSTDAFHAAALTDEQFVRAAAAVAEAGAWLVVQAVESPETVERVTRLVREALGDRPEERCELKWITLLPYGRAAAFAQIRPSKAGREFGRCGAVAAPVVRYDGIVTACCNEQVIMGMGPGRLRSSAPTAPQVAATVRGFWDDPVLSGVGGCGLGALTAHPRFAALGDRSFQGICSLCWELQRASPPVGEDRDPVLAALPLLSVLARDPVHADA